LPKVLVHIHRPGEDHPQERFVHTEETVSAIVAEESARAGRSVEVMESRHVLLSQAEAEDNGGEGGDEPKEPVGRIVRFPLSECRVIDEILARIEAKGLAVGDLFLTREELVTGELPPARFLIRDGEQKPHDMNNLAEVGPGVRSLGREGMAVKRFKGLGEMNSEELWVTTMDPQVRTLLRVVISEDMEDIEQAELDAREADRIFRLLMGDNVEIRRRFIEENATNVKNLDV
jgi:DNA gyrase subunit B